MLFNDVMILEVLILTSIGFYVLGRNLLTLLYIGGTYLILIGILLFLNDADIYVGFLWVIDLGVGLIFFIFILHFSSFLSQKSQLNNSLRYFFMLGSFIVLFCIYEYYFPISVDNSYYKDLLKTWFLRLTYSDYYFIYNTFEVTDLNLLRDSYFVLNSFEFFIVNFSLLFGLITAILMCFMVQRIFSILNFSQIVNLNILQALDTNFFIRQQSFIRQQNTPGVVKVWLKAKSTHLN